MQPTYHLQIRTAHWGWRDSTNYPDPEWASLEKTHTWQVVFSIGGHTKTAQPTCASYSEWDMDDPPSSHGAYPMGPSPCSSPWTWWTTAVISTERIWWKWHCRTPRLGPEATGHMSGALSPSLTSLLPSLWTNDFGAQSHAKEVKPSRCRDPMERPRKEMTRCSHPHLLRSSQPRCWTWEWSESSDVS